MTGDASKAAADSSPAPAPSQSQSQSPPPRSPSSLARLLLTLFAGEAAVSLASSLLARWSIAALAFEVGVAEWTSGKIGVSWGERGSLRAAKGVAFGLGLAAFLMTVSRVTTRGALVVNRPMATTLFLGLGTAVLSALRDELLLRGSVLRIVRVAHPRAPMSRWTFVLSLSICALVGAAHAAGEEGSLRAVVAGAALAVIFAALWLLDGGLAWRPIAAHAAWTFAESGLAGSGVIDLRAGPDGPALDAFRSSTAAIALVFVAVACAAAGAVTFASTKQPILAKTG